MSKARLGPIQTNSLVQSTTVGGGLSPNFMQPLRTKAVTLVLPGWTLGLYSLSKGMKHKKDCFLSLCSAQCAPIKCQSLNVTFDDADK